ncbi:polymerase II transcription elongation factor [Mycena sanguinolenta]|uniref:Polymerase II transcription elongation factor n=1 Tax=Mycena sanguinolenta TaxID=230812 RepID=A0A8H6Y304_9AGAR|nr:polymerase II transcription elongation factor [Mycena sanguinolenta]
MGTRGFRVYRHNGYYHVHYHSWDSYPERLGVEVAEEVPRDPEKYQEWLERFRQSLDDDVKAYKSEIKSRIDFFVEDGDYIILNERPFIHLMITMKISPNDIAWTYELDLDHEVFLVDSNPLFSLKNMPPSSETFLDWIGDDSYGHCSYAPSTPKQHIYNWKAVPPVVDDCVIQEYAARQPNFNHSSISQMLGTESIDDCEAVRIALYEAIVGEIMHTWEFGHRMRVLETVSERACMPEIMLSLAVDVVHLTIGPMFFGQEFKHAPNVKGLAFSWLTTVICLRVTTHLDDERNLKKSILELVDEVALNGRPGIVSYGILFSFFHCVIIRVGLNKEFESTAVLEFLPSFYAASPSTPGITAIGRLAYHCLATGANSVVDTNHFLYQVPVEVLELITARLTPFDLYRLCAAIPLFEPAAGVILGIPHIEDLRLLEVLEDGGTNYGRPFTCKAFSTKVQHVVGPTLVVGSRMSHSFGISFDTAVMQVNWSLEGDRDTMYRFMLMKEKLRKE